MPVPDKWCIGITHQGKINDPKAENMIYKQVVYKAELVHKALASPSNMSSFQLSVTCWCKMSSTVKTSVHAEYNSVETSSCKEGVPQPAPLNPFKLICFQTGQMFWKKNHLHFSHAHHCPLCLAESISYHSHCQFKFQFQMLMQAKPQLQPCPLRSHQWK